MEVRITFDEVNVRDTQKINDIDIVMVKGEKGDTGYPTDAQVATAVDEWLTEHPEATTTVQDGSITLPKLANDIRAEIDTKADAIVKSANGSIASFSDGGDDLPMKSLKVNIVPKQSGSGDPSPSNVRPISGWDAVAVEKRGANLFNIDGGRITLGNFKSGMTVYAQSNRSTEFTIYARVNGSGVPVSAVGGNRGKVSFTLTQDADALVISQADYNTLVSQGVYLMLSLTDFTAYEPYNGSTITTNLPQTVYGGTLDVVSGELNITHKLVTFNGSESWGFTAGSGKNRVNLSIADAKRGAYSIDIWGNYIKGTSEAMSMPSEWQGNINNLGALLLGVPTTITSANDWESYLANNPLTIVYPLATTTELTLTPTEVKTLLGANNIWSESGTVEVEYRADTTLAYNELLSLIASLS